MIQRSPLVLFSLFLFSSLVIADDAIKQSASEETQAAEDELSKLEQTVGEQADSAEATDVEDKAVKDKAIKDEASSKPWLPAAKDFDWVQLTSGEWLKGEIKTMYNNSLEFDSDKLDLLNIDWDDVKYLKSYRPSNVNIEDIEPLTGSLQISGDKVTITDGENVQEFNRNILISLTPSGDREKDLWSIKFSLGLNIRSGNTDQLDYNSKFNAKRNTAKTRFQIDYIGNISKTGDENGNLTETVNNNRVSTSLSYYATRYFYYTPIYAEYYADPFQNIDHRITAGIGLGYTIYDTDKYEWNVNGGPAYVSTTYVSVQPGENEQDQSGAVIFGTDFDTELTSTLDFIFKYNIQAGDADVGGYTHHMIATFENEITGSLDFDISLVWDRISQPATDADGNTPVPDDYRLTLGVTYTY
jgi:hypothetical protein